MNQMRRVPFAKYLLAACLLLWCSISRADDQNKTLDMAVKDRLLQEAPIRWEEYEERVQYLQGVQRFQLSLKGAGKTVKINRSLERKANKTCKSSILDFEQTVNGKVEKSPSKVSCVSPRYGFNLERRKNDSPWLLYNIVQDNLADFNKRFFSKGYHMDNALLITFDSVRLMDIAKRKEFQITACRTLNVDSELLVEVAFDFNNKGIEEEFPFEGGIIVLDPERFWCLRSYEARMRHPAFQGRIVLKVLELGETAGSFPWPKHVVIDSSFIDGREKTEDFSCDLQIPATLPSEDEFTLTAYGLPEPSWLAKKPTPWYLVFAGIGTVCLGVFFYLRSRAKLMRV